MAARTRRRTRAGHRCPRHQASSSVALRRARQGRETLQPESRPGAGRWEPSRHYQRQTSAVFSQPSDEEERPVGRLSAVGPRTSDLRRQTSVVSRQNSAELQSSLPEEICHAERRMSGRLRPLIRSRSTPILAFAVSRAQSLGEPHRRRRLTSYSSLHLQREYLCSKARLCRLPNATRSSSTHEVIGVLRLHRLFASEEAVSLRCNENKKRRASK